MMTWALAELEVMILFSGLLYYSSFQHTRLTGDGFYYPRAAGGRTEPPPGPSDGSEERQRLPGAGDALPLRVPGRPGRHSELQLDRVGEPSFWKTLACYCEAL